MRVRRKVLGDAHVDRAVAAATPFTAEFQDLLTVLRGFLISIPVSLRPIRAGQLGYSAQRERHGPPRELRQRPLGLVEPDHRTQGLGQLDRPAHVLDHGDVPQHRAALVDQTEGADPSG